MSFFEEQKEQSHIKSEIVKKYFWAWAKVICPRTKNISYIDLYAGKGTYDDGKKSTPILVLENALRDELMKQKLVSFFNDTNPEYAKSLEKVISEIPNINKLKNNPRVTNFNVGEDIVKQLQSMKLIPTLLFVDPWGYKGLTLDLIGSVLKDWGCDCIFFFNYVRINAGLNNNKFDCHINAIFSKKRAMELRQLVKYKRPSIREGIILDTLKEALKEIGGQYVISFKFYKTKEKRTSHFLVFVSKNVLGYKIMKGIMAECSSEKHQGVATFEYNPHKCDYGLFPPRPLDELETDLIKKYAGQRLTVGEIIQKHNFGTPYIESNYKEALLNLEKKQLINTNPAIEKRRKMNGKPTMGDTVTISFQKNG